MKPEYELGPVRVISVAFWGNNDSVVDPNEAVKLIMGGTPLSRPPTWENALSTRACVRLRMWVVNSIGHEEFRRMVREVYRIHGGG